MSLKPSILGSGVIDSNFRGIIFIFLTNLSKDPVKIEVAHRVAQMLFFLKRSG